MNRQQRRAAERARAKEAARGAGPRVVSGLASTAQRLLGQQRWRDAEQTARDALKEDPDDHVARAALRTALWRQGRLDEAMLEARRLVRSRPDDAAGHEAMAFILLAQDRVPESAAAFEKALALASDRWTAHVGLANSLATMGALDEALRHHERAVELAPDAFGAHNDLARTRHRMGDFGSAARAYERAAQCADGPSPLLEWNRALALLGMGDLRPGWVAYEAGLAAGARTPDRSPDVPRWAGEDLSDSTVLVWGEQGLGDEVRFAACFGDIIDVAAQVVIEANPRLAPLFARSFPDATVRGETFDRLEARETTSFEGVDFHIPSGSLPRYFRPTVDSFPSHDDGYLEADPGRRRRFRERLADLPGGLRVGICWRSMNLATDRLSHYTTLDEWEPVLRLPGVTFVNLQYGDAALRETELDEAEARTGAAVHRWADVDYTVDVEEVAALTAELDVVIGPNTFSTILAGALGVPTLVIGLPAIWQHGQEREPWTPSALHLTRRWDESWATVMEQAARELQQWASA